MPTREVHIWDGRSSDDVHDSSSRAASDQPQSSSPIGRSSSSTSASSTTTETSDKSSDRSDKLSKRGNNSRRFPFSSGSVEIKTPPPLTTPTRPIIATVDVKRNSVFPVGWILGTMVRDVYTAISQWILDGISAWLLQRSFLGTVHRQVFRDWRHRMKAGPLSILVTPPPMDEMVNKKMPIDSEREIRKSKTVKLLDEPDSDLLLIGGGAAAAGMATIMTAQEEPAVVIDDGSSHTVQWVIFAIEVMALIPIVVIGLSLFYILAVGIYNDVQDLLRRLFGETDSEEREEQNTTSSGEF